MKTIVLTITCVAAALSATSQLCKPGSFSSSSWLDPSLSGNCSSGCTNTITVTDGTTYTVAANNKTYCLTGPVSSSATITINFSSKNNTVIKVCTGTITINVQNPGSKQSYLIGSNASLTMNTAIGTVSNTEKDEFYNYGILNFNYGLTLNNNSLLMSLGSSSVINFKNSSTISSTTNNQTQIYLNGGYMNIDNLTLSNSNGMCLASASTVNCKTFTNSSTNSVTVPSGSTGCINFSQTATLNNSVTTSSGLTLCRNSSASITNAANKGSATLSYPCSSCSVVLPVTFSYFNLYSHRADINIKWATLAEVNIAGFEIQRSADGFVFSSLASLPASGTSQTQRTYSYTDVHPLRCSAYYRLKINDKDGRATYSGVKMIYTDASIADNKLKVLSPQGAGNIVVILPQTDCVGVLRIIDMQGNIAMQQFAKGNQQMTVAVNNLANGFYFVQFVCNALKQTEHIVIAK